MVSKVIMVEMVILMVVVMCLPGWANLWVEQSYSVSRQW